MSGWLRANRHVDTRAGRVLALILVFSVGLAASFALFAGGNASARDALTTPSLCKVENCATVVVSPDQGQDFGDTGSGSVTSSPTGLDCTLTAPATHPALATLSGTCTWQFSWPLAENGLAVTLNGVAATGSYSSGPTGATYSSTLTNGESIGFAYAYTLVSEALTVSRSGAGTGTVTSTPAGIACGATCTTSVGYGTSVSLTAVPDAGASFLQWTGACNGQGAVCTLQPKMALSTDGVFGLAGQTTTAATTTVKTTTTSTTTTATTATTPTVTVDQGAGHQVRLDAQLVAVKTARSKLGARLVEVEITSNEKTTVLLDLTRAKKTLASHTSRAVGAGDKVLTLIVPENLKKGTAVIHATVETTAGGKRTFHATVTIPHA
jgi:flagellin-like hook-associated protein FlgL